MCELQKVMPERTFDVGISEGHAVTFAAGMAKDGLLPYVAIYSSFLQRGYDQIIHDIAIQHLPVVLCIDRAGLVGEDGVTHHGTFDLAYLRPVPGITIGAPRDERTLRNMMYSAQANPEGPYAIRYPRGNGREPQWQSPFEAIEPGTGEKLADGGKVAVLALGTSALDALDAARLAKDHGVDAAVWDMRFLKPLDISILKEVAASGMPVITVEDGSMNGGLGSAVAEWFADNGISLKLTRLGLPDAFVDHGSVAQLKKLCGIDTDSILNAIIAAAK